MQVYSSSVKSAGETKASSLFRVLVFIVSICNLMVATQKYTDDLNVYLFKQVMLVMFIVYFLWTKKLKIDIRKMAVYFCLAFVISSLNMFNSIDFENALMNSLMYSAVALAIFIFPEITHKQFVAALSVFLIAISLVVTIPSLLSLNDWSLYTFYKGRSRFIGVMDNENTFGKMSLLATVLSVRLWSHWNGIFKKFFLVFMVLSSVYLIYLADSRTSMFTLIILLGVCLLFIVYKHTPIKLFISLVVFVLCIPITLALFVFNSTAIDIDLNELTTGRVSIWQEMVWDMDWKGYIVGMGEGVGRSSHNGYLETFRYFGILGVLFWFPILGYLIIRKWKCSKRNNDYLGFLIVFSFLAYYLTEGALMSLANLFAIYFWIELMYKGFNNNQSEQTVDS